MLWDFLCFPIKKNVELDLPTRECPDLGMEGWQGSTFAFDERKLKEQWHANTRADPLAFCTMTWQETSDRLRDNINGETEN